MFPLSNGKNNYVGSYNKSVGAEQYSLFYDPSITYTYVLKT